MAGGPIAWESRKQKVVSLSSTEAEYIAITEACKEAIFIGNLLNELCSYKNVITLYNDNQSSQKLAYNPVFHNRTKHIDVKYHFVREVVEKVDLRYLSTNKHDC